MASHYLFDPEFCNPASGWEKGQVEKNVQDARRRLWQPMPSFPDLDALNAWLEAQCIAQWAQIEHSVLPVTGPCESECPASILDVLTDTDSEYATAWRARCRANLLRRKLERAKPIPKPGQTIIFDEPMRFGDGSDRTRFEVVANPKGKRPLFRDPESRTICRIPAFRKRSYRIVHPAIVPKDGANG